MKCSLNTVYALITVAWGLLGAAFAAAYFWPTAAPLFAAAAMVATVSYYLIPHIKSALLSYVACRGPSEKCSPQLSINTLGQAAATLSVVSFLAAGLLQVTALAFISTWILAAIGIAMEPAVVALVYSGITSCVITIVILLGVLLNAWSYENCMDRQAQITHSANH